MTVDALDVRRAGLLYQAEDVLIQLEEPRVAPWLLQIDTDPVALASKLRAALAETRRAVTEDDEAQSELKARMQQKELELERARVWQAELRARLRRAAPGEPARRAVAELRTFTRNPAKRLASTLVLLHAASERLLELEPVLGPDVSAAALAASADALRAALILRRSANDEALAVTLRTGPAAVGAVEALRRVLREVRAVWRFARSVSRGALPPLNLATAKSMVLSRPGMRVVEEGPDVSGGGGPV